MERWMFPFQHDDVVRFILPGGVAVLAFVLLHPPAENLASFSVGAATLLAVFMLVVGNLLHGLHRAVLYPQIFALFLFGLIRIAPRGGVAKPRRVWPLLLALIHFSEAERLVTFWEACQYKPNDVLWGHLRRISLRVHFLYTCGWAIILALATAGCDAPYAASARGAHTSLVLWLTALGCVWGAVISDWRWMSIAYNGDWTNGHRSYLVGSRPIVLPSSEKPEPVTTDVSTSAQNSNPLS
jgi:hypothetical protein